MTVYMKDFGLIKLGLTKKKELTPYIGKRLWTYHSERIYNGEIYNVVYFAVVPDGVQLSVDNIDTYKVKDIVGLAILATCAIETTVTI